MAACVEIWESDPEALHYHGSGYIALGPPAQEPDLVEVHERHQRIGYPSELIIGERRSSAHMRALYPDWRAPGLTVCLHEHARRLRVQPRVDARPGRQGARGRRADRRGRRGHRLRVRRLGRGDARAARARATIAVEQVVVAVGPWIASLWEMLGLPDRIDVHQPDGAVAATCRCGPTGTCRRARSRSTRRRSSPPTASLAGAARRLRPAAARRRRAADHRRAVGHLLQARPRARSRAAPSR